ncbi:hypothetical protein LTR78_003929 [Recurvomyces mirabilis]|uniref:Heterokaryon incompatibility domain-containing protein n=1 Tax=Recurvomyces mirabilis TaxID=574656 RepID=A0AAE0WQY9_9PEZI|nr:hypothetical protein LTR78_003929 [Recurvomyces mirabilis]KAK5153933.1 hypothetical protein LTS14_007153 [Recurvomyces mirabilis]
MVATNTHFSYSPLDTSQRQFRLVRLLPGGSENKVKAELASFSLDAEVSYIALSYRWGAPTPLYKIQLNGQPFDIQPNLHEFLQYVRVDKSTDWYFIDAICINQNDAAERSSQVRLMGKVYSSAHSVTAWLSDATDRKFRRRMDTFIDTYGTDEKIQASREAFENEIVAIVWSCIYWTRLWIIQELVLAKRIVVQLEHYRLTWVALVSGMRSFFAREVGDPTLWMTNEWYPLSNSNRNARVMLGIMEIRRQRAAVLLPHAMIMFGQQGSAVLHDKAFALLGIAISSMQVDYDAPISQIYIRVLIEGIRQIEIQARQPYTATDMLRKVVWMSVISATTAFGWTTSNETVCLIVQEVTSRDDLRVIRSLGFGASAVSRWKYPKGLGFVYDAMDQLARTPWYSDYIDKKLQRKLERLSEQSERMHLPGCVDDARTVAEWIALIDGVRRQVETDVASPGYAAKVRSALVLNDNHSALVEPDKVE